MGEKFTLKLYREKGSQFWNVDSVVKGHESSSPQASGSNPSGGSYNNNANPAAIGQAINLAVELGLVRGYQDFTDDVISDAIMHYKVVKKKFTEMWDKVAVEEVKPTPPKPAPSEYTPPLVEDDIPF